MVNSEDYHQLPVPLVDDIIETLEHTPCQFWACPGPDVPPEAMRTCYVCSTLWDLRQALNVPSEFCDRCDDVHPRGAHSL